MVVFGYLLITLVASYVIWLGSELLDRSAEKLSRYYQWPVIVQGTLLVAIGSSFPELTSTIIATVRHGQFSLGVSAIVGSAIFNILVIPGLSAIFAKQKQGLVVSKDLVRGDVIFYAFGLSVTMIVFAFALIFHPVEGVPMGGTVTWQLVLLPLGTYGLYVFQQYQEVVLANKAALDAPDSKDASTQQESINPLVVWAKLAFSMILIAVAVEFLVVAGIEIGTALGVDTVIWGLTVLAAATSLPDTKISVDAARRGEGDLCIANTIGSNVFDLLFCNSIPVLMVGSVAVSFSQMFPMLAVLTFATIVLWVLLMTGLRLERWEGYFLLGTYGFFVVTVWADVAGHINFLQL